MNKTHSIDKPKVEARLLKLGWRRGQYGEWIMPTFKTRKELDEDYEEAILCSIVCEHEKRIVETKEFLEKHPTPKRT